MLGVQAKSAVNTTGFLLGVGNAKREWRSVWHNSNAMFMGPPLYSILTSQWVPNKRCGAHVLDKGQQ